jgi:hypothetical protein
MVFLLFWVLVCYVEMLIGFTCPLLFFDFDLQFLDFARTPYAAIGNQHVPAEETKVNPSASLNEWLVFPSSQELEVFIFYLFCYIC